MIGRLKITTVPIFLDSAASDCHVHIFPLDMSWLIHETYIIEMPFVVMVLIDINSIAVTQNDLSICFILPLRLTCYVHFHTNSFSYEPHQRRTPFHKGKPNQTVLTGGNLFWICQRGQNGLDTCKPKNYGLV